MFFAQTLFSVTMRIESKSTAIQVVKFIFVLDTKGSKLSNKVIPCDKNAMPRHTERKTGLLRLPDYHVVATGGGKGRISP